MEKTTWICEECGDSSKGEQCVYTIIGKRNHSMDKPTVCGLGEDSYAKAKWVEQSQAME